MTRRFRRLRLFTAVLLYGCSAPALAQETVMPEHPRFSYHFNVNYFIQASSRQNYAFTGERFDDDETFFWERLRPKLTVSTPHANVVIEGQDTHARGSQFVVRKAWLDLLNAYVDVKPTHGWWLKVGRRQGDFDTISRMILTPEFAAVVRSFDTAEVGWQRGTTDARALVFRTVDNLPTRFNTWRKGERLWALFLRQDAGHHRLQTYITTRLNSDASSETGALGSGAVYAWEVRANGPVVPHLSYTVEHVLERGHVSTDRLRAGALFASLETHPHEGHDIDVRYVRASGDHAQDDGRKGGYDSFYMAVGSLGQLGIMRANNLQSLSVHGTHVVAPKASLNWRLYDSRLATLGDGWYSTRFIKRSAATSSRLGREADLFLTYNHSKRLTARFGYMRFFPGPYLKDVALPGSPYELRVQLYGDF